MLSLFSFKLHVRELLDNITGVFKSIECGEKQAGLLGTGAGTH